MKKDYLIITGLCIVFIVAVGYGFTVIGSPFERQAQQFDQTRLSNFSNLSYTIQNYYALNKKLPARLSDLSISAANSNDPKTKTPYTYTIISEMSYNLCTVFDTDSNTNLDKYPYNTYPNQNHRKGYDCIRFTIPDYYNKINP